MGYPSTIPMMPCDLLRMPMHLPLSTFHSSDDAVRYMKYFSFKKCPDGLPILINGYFINQKGEIYRGGSMTRVNTSYNVQNGYEIVTFSVIINQTRHQITANVHTLMCATYHGALSKGCVVDHINHNRRDNRLENLRVLTTSLNNRLGKTHSHRLELEMYADRIEVSFVELKKLYDKCQKDEIECGIAQGYTTCIGRYEQYALMSLTAQMQNFNAF